MAIRTNITIVRSTPGLRCPSAEASTAAETVFRGERKAGRNVSIILTDSKYIHRINKAFLAHDRPTDVISFPLHDEEGMPDEVYVNVQYARSQAKEYHVPMREEFLRLVIHGCLHLCGFRDGTAAEKQEMRKAEERYLRVMRRSK